MKHRSRRRSQHRGKKGKVMARLSKALRADDEELRC